MASLASLLLESFSYYKNLFGTFPIHVSIPVTFFVVDAETGIHIYASIKFSVI